MARRVTPATNRKKLEASVPSHTELHRQSERAETLAKVADTSLATPVCRLLIGCAAVAAYHDGLFGPFVFDDVPAILENFTIKNLGNIGRVLAPPLTAAGAVGRPIVNLSLAINYALGGTHPVGYHIVNLCLHVLVALTLFSVL